MSNRRSGRVEIFDPSKGFGFIQGFDGIRVFVHFSDIIGDGYKTLTAGQVVEYNFAEGGQGPKAIAVKKLERNIMVAHNTEDKQYWCSKGENEEISFVNEIVPRLGRNIIVHPEKQVRKTSIDLFDLDRNIAADLKTQTTPFFTAGKYGFDPQFTVTFNRKDYIYYKDYYPEAIIYWWVNWQQLQLGRFRVEPLYGVWEVPFSTMRSNIEIGEAPLHEYKHRKDDNVNARESYLFNLRNFQRLL